MEIAGFGALNLDHVYEVDNLGMVRDAGFDLYPGREISGSADDAARLHKLLGNEGRLLARSGGGSAANTICILAALGHETAFIGTAGDDDAGDFILGSMGGVDCSMVRRQGLSGQCIVIIESRTRDRAMFVVPGSASPGLPDHLDFSQARMLHMSSLAIDEGPRIQERLAEMMRPDQVLSFDPGELYAARGMKELAALFARTNLLFITREELKMLDPARDGYGVYQALNRERGAPVMVVKQGSRGAAAFVSGQDWFQPAVQVRDVVDNTGAGDAFNAGFIHTIMAGRPVPECLKYAVELAAQSLKDYGRNWLSNITTL
jgi:ribokinase